MKLERIIRVAVCGATGVATLALGTGCPTTSLGIDLAVRGGLDMGIYENGDSGDADVTATFDNTLGGPKIILTSDQNLTVNGTGFSVSTFTGEYLATLASADTYVIEFTGQGTTESMSVRQETGLENVEAATTDGSVEITWSPSGENGVTVEVLVDGSSEGRSADSGSFPLDQQDLEDFGPGTHTATLRRFRTAQVSPAFGGLLDRADVRVGTQLTTDFVVE